MNLLTVLVPREPLLSGPPWLGWACIILGVLLLALGLFLRWWRR